MSSLLREVMNVMRECSLGGGMCKKGFPSWRVGGEEGQVQVWVQMWPNISHEGLEAARHTVGMKDKEIFLSLVEHVAALLITASCKGTG